MEEEKSLIHILSNKYLHRIFKLFLEERYASENLSFWMEIENYKLENASLRTIHIDTIWKKYFTKDSIYEINIDEAVKTQTHSLISQSHNDSNLFDQAQKAIFRMLEMDHYREFILSEPYKRYLQGGEEKMSSMVGFSNRKETFNSLNNSKTEFSLEAILNLQEQKYGKNERNIPFILQKVVEYIMDFGLNSEELFSTRLSNPKIDEIIHLFQDGENGTIPRNKFSNKDVAGTLRSFILRLNHTLVPSELISIFTQPISLIPLTEEESLNSLDIYTTGKNLSTSRQLKIKKSSGEFGPTSVIEKLRINLQKIPELYQPTIQSLFFIMHHIYLNNSINKIPISTLTKVLLPIFYRSDRKISEDLEEETIMRISNSLNFFIKEYPKIYANQLYYYGSSEYGYLLRKLVFHTKSVSAITRADENHFWTSDTSGVIFIWNSSRYSLIYQISLNSPLIMMKKFNDQMWCLTVRQVFVIDIKTRKILKNWSDECFSIAFVKGRAWLSGDHIYVRSVETFEIIKTIPLILDENSEGKLFSKSICLAEDKVWCGLSNGFLLVFDLNGDLEYTNSQAHRKAINDILYVNNNTIWTCSDDTTIAIWSRNDYRFIKRIEEHKSKVFRLFYLTTSSLFKQQVWSSCFEHTLIWNSTNFANIGKFEVPSKDCLSDIIFSVINEREIQVWATSFDRSVVIYNLYFNRIFKFKTTSVVIGSTVRKARDINQSANIIINSNNNNNNNNNDINNNNNNNNNIINNSNTDITIKKYESQLETINSNPHLQEFVTFYETLPDTVKKLNFSDVAVDYSRPIGKDKFPFDDKKNKEEKFGGTIGVTYKGKWKLQSVAIKKVYPHLISVSEYMEQRSLQDLIDANVQLKLLQRLKIAKGIAQALAWLHCSSPPVVHGSLTTSNILIDSYGKVRVADFGLLPLKELQKVDENIPNWHLAPEILTKSSSPTIKIDQYAFAIILWQIWNFRNIFVDGVKTYQQLVNYIRVENRLELDGVPSKLKGIITKCWSGNVNIRPPFTEIISQFNQVIIDCTILDTIGREIWSNNFYDTDEVPVGKFVNAILQQQKLYVKVNDPRLTCLKFILDEENKGIVEIETFGNSLWWFGPLSQSAYVDMIYVILQEPWFHGNLTREEAEAKLNRQERSKTFLVRFSSELGCYSISVLLNGSILHYRIFHEPGSSYQIGDDSFNSLKELIAKSAKPLLLKYPCPGSKYALSEKASDGYELFG